ncbi:hypothetical protein CC1G_11295 [Coprinopsis cinerea okayama7|uniref:Inner centromere protein ARK-binding domain-containing protein n=1 Tax=Coprinopsis cinerea (strain Okayama-7 / 130 / ATCC MYA-4618 / FGSC 9003) TaxID=240176 RepID=A8N1F6_COPC7|nr:hypothetical protein CC1G_11295 [Coprinopsis cinerea okayama7\|eukprot:XP_001828705.2 hypothetical protein CC1G_11295 [Coprinopsis cinerea okayama7\
MSQDGLLQWANSIRFNMASDSGRQIFQQQVQTHGFLFLDDYLDNILSGAKQDPLIELVKTPGRRKAIVKKPKLASKLGNPISFSLEPTQDENVPPKASATKSLFPPIAKREKSVEPATEPVQQNEHVHPSPGDGGQSKDLRAEHDSAPAPPKHLAVELAVPVASNQEANNLSMIAEDDENDSAMSIEDPTPATTVLQAPPGQQDEPAHRTSATAERKSSGRDTSPQSSAPSPSEYHSANGTPVSSTFPTSAEPPVTEERSEEEQPKPQPEPPKCAEMQEEQRVQDDLLKVEEVVDMQVPLKDEDTTTKGILNIPSLPEPGPLRKSTRTFKDPSMGATTLGTTTPGPGVGGKRTSWLRAAREVKALESTAKKSNVMQTGVTPAFSSYHLTQATAGSSKRKSDDVNESQGTTTPWDSSERKSKATKNLESDVAPLKSQAEQPPAPVDSGPKSTAETLGFLPSPQGVLDRLKKTVEGLGARVNKTNPKGSEDTVAANTFAEAKAAAEARIAERNFKEDETMPFLGATTTIQSKERDSDSKMEVDKKHVAPPAKEVPRLSMSDLFPSDSRIKEKHKIPEKPLSFSSKSSESKNAASRESTSTTPPNSPPPSGSSSAPSAPVFSHPTPVFVAPAPSAPRPLPSLPAKERVFHPQPGVFSAQPQLGLGLASTSPKFNAFKPPPAPLTAQSTYESVRSDSIFDKVDDAPTWVPSTQDTEYTSTYETQHEHPMNVCDEDDSWPVDEKLAAGMQWTFGANIKEDSMTWSTLPSQSQRADTGPLEKSNTQVTNDSREADKAQDGRAIPGAFDVDMVNDGAESDNAADDELEGSVLSAAKSTSQHSETKAFRPQSQMSMASSSSSQSQGGGFLNQASKLISSALGTSKKKPEVKKVLQMAAVAAKKQQEEADKKAARLKDMEIRRQAAMQRKAEEEKAKALEEERKLKEEIERRKRDRDEMTDKRPLKPAASSKKDEEPPKFKKPEPEKKSILKKTASGTLGKPQLKPALKSAATFSSFTTPNQPTQSQGSSSGKPVAESSKLPKAASSSSHKGKSKMPAGDDDVSQPSQLLQGQMAARAKAQMKAAKQAEPLIPSEAIELPDINSEYSDSEDEDRPRTFDPPAWAQSPELKEALELQSTINPDDIFGAVKPLRMEEIFRTRTSRFRARTSSANWTGTDMLTVEEEREYAKRMGFK